MTAEGVDTTITTPNQAALEIMAEDGSDMVYSDPGLMREISQGLVGGVVAHVRAYRAQPAIQAEGETL
jgi:hypothetical protein